MAIYLQLHNQSSKSKSREHWRMNEGEKTTPIGLFKGQNTQNKSGLLAGRPSSKNGRGSPTSVNARNSLAPPVMPIDVACVPTTKNVIQLTSPSNKIKTILSILDVKRHNTSPFINYSKTLDNRTESSMHTMDESCRNASRDGKRFNESRLLKTSNTGNKPLTAVAGYKSKEGSPSPGKGQSSGTNKDKLKKIIGKEGIKTLQDENNYQNGSVKTMKKGGNNSMNKTMKSNGSSGGRKNKPELDLNKQAGLDRRPTEPNTNMPQSAKNSSMSKVNSFRAIIASRKKIAIDMSQQKLMGTEVLKTTDSAPGLAVTESGATAHRSGSKKNFSATGTSFSSQTPKPRKTAHAETYQTPSAIGTKHQIDTKRSLGDTIKANKDNLPSIENLDEIFSPSGTCKGKIHGFVDKFLATTSDASLGLPTRKLKNSGVTDRYAEKPDHQFTEEAPKTARDQCRDGSTHTSQKIGEKIEGHSTKHKLNLELVIDIEDILQNIQNCFRSGTPILSFCKAYLELISRETFEGIDKLYRDEGLRQTIRSAIILEKTSVMLFLYCFYERTITSDVSMSTALRKLCQIVHMNFLVLLDLIFNRISGQSTANSWYKRFKILLDVKHPKRGSKKENLETMRLNNQETIKMIMTIFESDNSEFIRDIKEVIAKIDKLEISQAQFHILQALNEYKVKENVPDDKELLKGSTSEERPTSSIAIPYLPPMIHDPSTVIYTLVLDLDETLVHYEDYGADGGKFLLRPHAEEFLKEMSIYYEIVVFTAAMQDYADWVLDNLDPNRNMISHRLYRQHAVPNGVGYVKDLSRLGRDLSRTIIVDNVPENFQLQADNGIFIRSWFNDPDDTALAELSPLLKEIVRKKCLDVRVALRKFRDQMLENLNNGLDQPHLHLTLDEK